MAREVSPRSRLKMFYVVEGYPCRKDRDRVGTWRGHLETYGTLRKV